MISRREFSTGVAALGLGSLAKASTQTMSPAEQLKNIVRVIGDESGRVCPTTYSGKIFALMPGQRLQALIRFQGAQLSFWTRSDSDSDRYRILAYTCSVFRDLESGEILKAFDNPYTGQRDVVKPNLFLGSVYTYSTQGIWMGDDPVNVRYGPRLDLDWQFDSEVSRVSCDRPYDDRFSYPYGESRVFSFANDDLDHQAISAVPNMLNSVSTLPWPKWMGEPENGGVCIYHATGKKLENVDQYPPDLRTAIDAYVPKFFERRSPG